MNNLTVFEFQDQSVRFVDGFPVANDVATILGYKDPANAVCRIVDQEYKGFCNLQTPSVTILKEQCSIKSCLVSQQHK